MCLASEAYSQLILNYTITKMLEYFSDRNAYNLEIKVVSDTIISNSRLHCIALILINNL